MISDEENELLVAHDILQTDIQDSENKLKVIKDELKVAEENITKTNILHTATLEALESLAQSKIVALDQFKALTMELRRVNDYQVTNINTRSQLLKTQHELTAEIRRTKSEFELLERKVKGLVVAETRKVLEFKKP